jgi:hypothetical protein
LFLGEAAEMISSALTARKLVTLPETAEASKFKSKG